MTFPPTEIIVSCPGGDNAAAEAENAPCLARLAAASAAAFPVRDGKNEHAMRAAIILYKE
jgi:hypothetical protein